LSAQLGLAVVLACAAAPAGRPYSPAIRAFAKREERWTPELLGRFLAAPYGVAPKTTMGFPGLPDEANAPT
jgi:cytochrome c2